MCQLINGFGKDINHWVQYVVQFFLKRDKENVLYTDDRIKKCEIFGIIKFEAGNELDKNNKDLYVELKFGDNFIDTKIKYKVVEKSTPLFFDNNNGKFPQFNLIYSRIIIRNDT